MPQKDPAMLWYWSDWNSGTILLSRFLKGCYIDVLNAEFNNGPLSLEEIKICLGADFANSWLTLQKKFKQNEKGLFFNERLEREKQKRIEFSESRRTNRKKTYDTTYDKHMIQHMENTNRNENKNEIKEEEKGVGKGEGFFLNEKVMEDLSRIEMGNVKSFIHSACQKKIIDVDVRRYWDAFRINNQNLHEWYESREKLMIHFRHSLKLEINNQKNSNGNSLQKPGKRTGKDEGANQLLEELRADFTDEQG